ncbi:MAG: hypothetical protein H6R19_2114 [Proteobacteria bacterium]|nr:hypothetical protein [Pseudomonadota bacterium]
MEAVRFHSSITISSMGVFLTAKRGWLQEAIDTYGSLNAAANRFQRHTRQIQEPLKIMQKRFERSVQVVQR